MFLAHAFRLRDPWQCEQLEGGALRWSRVFHRPTGLEPDDQLVLVISGLPPNAQVNVNGHTFASPEPAAGRTPAAATQFDLTPILADANKIDLLISSQASSLKPEASFP